MELKPFIFFGTADIYFIITTWKLKPTNFNGFFIEILTTIPLHF